MTDEDRAVTDGSGTTPGRTARGLLWTVVVALLLAAAALAGSSALTWVEVPPGIAVDGRVGGDLSGGDVESWPGPMALLALAAVAASLALRGVAR
ncbi:Trp biosynthesis-associated membrane protein, partial [Saccharomonospora saliphila]|uniref:Trp biosynthesis-associated membrane protein n=1 Tax=Saccharomonospora saliphila TaxID=369829 RepID=UPI000382117F